MHSNAHARRTVATKETEDRVQQESFMCDTGIVITCSSSTLILLFNAVHSVAIQLCKPK